MKVEGFERWGTLDDKGRGKGGRALRSRGQQGLAGLGLRSATRGGGGVLGEKYSWGGLFSFIGEAAALQSTHRSLALKRRRGWRALRVGGRERIGRDVVLGKVGTQQVLAGVGVTLIERLDFGACLHLIKALGGVSSSGRHSLLMPYSRLMRGHVGGLVAPVAAEGAVVLVDVAREGVLDPLEVTLGSVVSVDFVLLGTGLVTDLAVPDLLNIGGCGPWPCREVLWHR